MVFNALISNLDDHPRNHALVCGLEGRGARRSNLVSQAARFGLGVDEADAIISTMKSIIAANWEGEVRRHGGTDEDCRRIASAFLNHGFKYTGGGMEW